jgi:hypothetical protein
MSIFVRYEPGIKIHPMEGRMFLPNCSPAICIKEIQRDLLKLGIGGGEIKENDGGGEFNYEIL